jgi:hypothetical protein
MFGHDRLPGTLCDRFLIYCEEAVLKAASREDDDNGK